MELSVPRTIVFYNIMYTEYTWRFFILKFKFSLNLSYQYLLDNSYTLCGLQNMIDYYRPNRNKAINWSFIIGTEIYTTLNQTLKHILYTISRMQLEKSLIFFNAISRVYILYIYLHIIFATIIIRAANSQVSCAPKDLFVI